MLNIFKKKQPNYSANASYQPAQNYSTASNTSIWKPKTPAQSFQSLFSSATPKAPQISRTNTTQSTQPKNYSSVIPASGNTSAYASNPTNYSPKVSNPPPVVDQKMVQPTAQNPQISLMDTFLRSQQGVSDQKKQLAEQQYQAGNTLREGTYNLQKSGLEGMREGAVNAFNQFEQGTLGGLERVRSSGERNKEGVEDYYGDAQRTAAMARRETQGDAQRRFSALNTTDSFGEGSYKQATENIDSDFNRVTQQYAKEKANKLADIDDQVFSAEQTANQAIESERLNLQQTLRQIDSTIQQGTMEHKFATEQAMAQYQETVGSIEEWFSGIQYQTEAQKLQIQQELAGMQSFTPEFMATGVPSNQQEYEFLIKNQDAFSNLYGFGNQQGKKTEKQMAYEAAGSIAQNALQKLQSGSVSTGIGQGFLGNIGESFGTNTSEQQSYRSDIAAMRTAIQNALLGANMSPKEMEQIMAAIPQYDDHPSIASQKLQSLIQNLPILAGNGQTVQPEQIQASNDQLVSQFGG